VHGEIAGVPDRITAKPLWLKVLADGRSRAWDILPLFDAVI
jgi:hypothetical protein